MKDFFQLIKNIFLAEQDRWNLWLPILFGGGISIYFLLPFEPFWLLGTFAFLLCLILFTFFRKNSICYCFLLGLCFLTGGFAIIQLKANFLSAPRLSKNINFVWVEGTVNNVELYPNAQRLTLEHVFIDRIPIEKTPKYVRIRSNGLTPKIEKGDIIEVRANLMPPGLPIEPGSYAFCRNLWFNQIGASGYATGKPIILQKNKNTPFFDIFEEIRRNIAAHVQAVLPAHQAGVVLPLIIGSTSSISQTTYENYRDAGIAHVLSVSGLHMMLIAGLVFSFVRFLLTLFPPIALRFNIKKIAAVIALIITFFYLMISGLAIPAQRSYLMLCVVFIAVLFDRQALSVRNVCWIAFLILLFKPESLVTASFQLSFGAVLALICTYETLKEPVQNFLHKQNNKLFRWMIGLAFGFLITNIAAGLATAPIAIYHFYRFPTYGILGNFLTSSLFGLAIMPLLLLSVLMMPFNLDVYPLKIAGFFLDLVANITEWIAHLPYASIIIPTLPDWGFLLLITGGIWFCLWKNKIRFLGLLFFLIGTCSFLFHTTSDLFISQGGKLIAYQEKGHFYFSSLNRQKKTRQQWMERNGFDSNNNISLIKEELFQINGYTIALSSDYCGIADIIIAKQKNAPLCDSAMVLDYKTLWNKGTHTLFFKDNNFYIKNAADSLGFRLWHPNYKNPFLLDFFNN